MNDEERKKLLKLRYSSLINRSFSLLLRYKIYCLKNADELNTNDYIVDEKIKQDFSLLYKKANRKKLIKINNDFKIYCDSNSNKKLIKKYKKNYKEKYFKTQMNIDSFADFWKDENKRSCGYCGIKENQINSLNIQTKRFYSRGKTMEIDKILPNGEYKIGNIILSCYWCNNAKSDEFSLLEFKEIARGINHTWNKRLRSIDIEFPENTYKIN